MKNITLISVILIFLSINLQAQKKNKNSTGLEYNKSQNDISEESNYSPMGYKNLPQKARHYFEGMKYVEGETFTFGKVPYGIKATDKDSTLIINNIPKRITVNSFFISDHEVTNAEYREFTNWVKTKTAMDILAKNYAKYRYRNKEGSYNETMPIDWKDSILLKELFILTDERFYDKYTLNTKKLIYDSIKIYPDTLCFLDIVSKDTLVDYFNNPVFDNYPVVGVNWEQANAYCHWRTERLNEEILINEGLLRRKSYYFKLDKFLENKKISSGIIYPNFRLPTEYEWEYAALHHNTEKNKYNYDYIFPWDNNKLTDDKGKYQANFGKIIDITGFIIKEYKDDGFFYTNPVKTYNANSFELYDMSGNVAEWLIDVFHSSSLSSDLENNSTTKKNKYQNPNSRIVKGGSWADGPVYIIPATKTIFSQNKSSSKIGFRVAMHKLGGNL